MQKQFDSRFALSVSVGIILLVLIVLYMKNSSQEWLVASDKDRCMKTGEKTISIPPGGAHCVDGKISVLIQNNGVYCKITVDDVIIAEINNQTVPKNPDLGSIAPGSGGLIIKDYDCGGVCKPGQVAIRVGTKYAIETTAICR